MNASPLFQRRVLAFGLLSLLLVAVAPVPSAQAEHRAAQKKPRDLTHFNLDKKGLALQGYDPVAYFPVGGGRPKRGLETIAATYEGVLYRFASEENKKLFLAAPEKFEPQYGGWCAYAMADKDKVEIDPKSFLVSDGKLYVFFKAWYADTRAKWLKDEQRLKERADGAWKVLKERPEPK